MNRTLKIFVIAIFATLSFSEVKADLCHPLRTESTQALYQGEKQRLAAEVVSHFYDKPTKSLLCRNFSDAQVKALQKSLRDHLHNDLINEFVQLGKCDQLASSRFGFPPLDTREAISESYAYHLSPLLYTEGQAFIEVRFRGKHSAPENTGGGAIVYLEEQKQRWIIANIESVEELGSNGFQSLLSDYPSVACPEWADMDYSKSLAAPTKRTN